MGSDLFSSLVDVADVIDSLHKTPKYADDGYAMVRCVNIEYGPLNLLDTKKVTHEIFEEYSKKYSPKEGDIIITRVGANFGETAYVSDTNFCLGQNTAAIIPKHIEPHYLYLFLNSALARHQMDVLSAGAAQPTLSIKSIKSLKIPRLGEHMEVQIADLIKQYNNKISLNRQINQTLEQMAQTLFKSWFVDFDPVIDNALDVGNPIPEVFETRVERRKAVRESADFKPLPDDVRQLFPSEFEESELGWVPKGWETSTAGQELTVKGGSTPSTKNPDFWDGGNINWTSPKDLSDNVSKIMLDTSRKITEKGLAKITSGLLPVNTVLMSSRAPIGYLALTKIPVAINQGYIAIPETKRLSQEFTMYWLDSVMDEIKGVAGGTTFAEISKKVFKEIGIIVPDKSVIAAFSNVVKSNLDKVTSNVEQSKSLTTLRDTLLPKLISGELRLDSPEVEQAKALVE